MPEMEGLFPLTTGCYLLLEAENNMIGVLITSLFPVKL